jgi:two-component system NarL family response regulator
MGRQIRLLIADDHPVVRQGLGALLALEADIAVAGQAENGAEAIALHRTLRPDVTLLDLRMPGVDGRQALKAILEADPDARVLILTTFDGDEDIHRVLRLGAKGYMLKDAPIEELLSAIRAVADGQTHLSLEAAGKLSGRVVGNELTAREIEVLQEMATGKGNQAIAEALFITEGTVKYHINNILSKLGVADRTQAVLIAMKRGIVWQA